MKSINPYTQGLIAEFDEWSEERLAQAVEASAAAYREWSARSMEQRIRRVKAMASLLRERQPVLAKAISMEMGKVIREAEAEIEKCAWLCDYYAENAPAFLAAKHIKTEMHKSYVAYQPMGTVLAVMPWNFPFWQVYRAAIPALLTGNVMLLKHASNVMGVALLIESLFKEAGFEESFIALIIGSKKIEQVLRSPTVIGVALTGSEAAGSAVASIAGKYIKKQVLELGGSDAFVVLEDADLAKAAEVAVKSRMLNAGQSCIAAKRFIVDHRIVDDFVAQVEAQLRKLHTGDPLSYDTQVGPMARLDLADELQAQMNRGLKQGAQLLLGGERDQCLFSPTLLMVEGPDNVLAREETFGPLMPVIAFKTEQEAIRIANDSRYGLGGSVWTRDRSKGEALALKIEAGSVFVNGMVRSDPRLPFGGIKNSGYGRELGEEGLLEFANIKSIVVE